MWAWGWERSRPCGSTNPSRLPRLRLPAACRVTETGTYNPTFLVSSGIPITVTWQNGLPMGDHLLPFDPTLMMGMPNQDQSMPDMFMTPIVTHLHGGYVAAIYDGNPLLTITPGQQTTYTYDNSQESGLIWYHDHSVRLTRLNVYAGMAGLYKIEDDNRLSLVNAGVLPDMLSEHPLVVQDRAYKVDGSLYYPSYADDPLPGTPDTVSSVLPPDYVANGGKFPTAVPEFFGDTILVNGAAWPHTDVGRGETMFDLLNGSDSRFYLLQLDNPDVKVTLVGVDGGLLPKPIVIMNGDGVQDLGEQIVFAPADRLQLLFDFSKLPSGQAVHLLNYGAAYDPFKSLDPTTLKPPVVVAADPNINSVGQIMEFRVNADVEAFHSAVPLTSDTVLNPDYQAIDATNALVRKLGVFEIADEFGRTMPEVGIAAPGVDNLGNAVAVGPLGFMAPVTELIQLGATEIWEFYNVTADAHPMHVHQVEYQVLGRYYISTTDTNGDGVVLQGTQDYNNDLGDLIDTRPDVDGIQNLYPEDTGWQDTVWVGPGEAIKFVMNFDRPGDYMWHCHILSHEDHDMMRSFKVLGFAGDLIPSPADANSRDSRIRRKSDSPWQTMEVCHGGGDRAAGRLRQRAVARTGEAVRGR